MYMSGSTVTSQKVKPQIIINLPQRGQPLQTVLLHAYACSYFSFLSLLCMHNKREHPEREGEGNEKSWSVNQVKVRPVSSPSAIFSPSPPCFPTFDSPTLSSFNLINFNKCRRRGQQGSEAGCPLCQMRSVDISHQTGADQRPPCAHAGKRIKPHHAQPPWQKKSLSTRIKRLSQEWNLIQGDC